MGQLVDEFVSSILPRIEDAVEIALGTAVAEEVKTVIQDKTEEIVYSYPTSAGLPRRREAGGIKDRANMEATASGLSLRVVSSVGLQNLFWSGEIGASGKAELAGIVESGSSAYHMPVARPYHRAAEEEIDGSAVIEGIIESVVNSIL